MTPPEPVGTDTEPVEVRGRLGRFFTGLVARRWWVLAVYALLVPPAAYLAAQVEQDNSIDR